MTGQHTAIKDQAEYSRFLEVQPLDLIGNDLEELGHSEADLLILLVNDTGDQVIEQHGLMILTLEKSILPDVLAQRLQLANITIRLLEVVEDYAALLGRLN